MDVRQLALAVGISNYDVVFWLKDCELKGDVLLVPDKTVGRFIANCWGQAMRLEIPDLRITVKPEPLKVSKLLNKRGQKWERERQASQASLTESDE